MPVDLGTVTQIVAKSVGAGSSPVLKIALLLAAVPIGTLTLATETPEVYIETGTLFPFPVLKEKFHISG